MEFLNTNPKRTFRLIEKNTNKLYVYGYFNLTDDMLFNILSSGSFPENIRGQFSFVFITKEYWIGCVDHLCSTNLYYTNNTISPLYNTIVKNTQKLTSCNLFKEQLKILQHDFTVGPFTEYNEISRIVPEHYIKNNKSYRYSDIINEPEYRFDIDHAYELFLNVISKVDLTNSTLCLSGGKDSSFIAMLLKHLNYNPVLVHIISKNLKTTIDKQACELYKKECNWDIEEYEIEYSGPITEDDYIFFQLWKDKTFPSKKHAVKKYPNNISLTGEVSSRGSGKMSNICANHIANIGRNNINIDHFVHVFLLEKFNTFFIKTFESITNMFDDTITKTEGYQYIFEHFRNLLNRIEGPLEKKIWQAYVEMKGPWRMWGQSQDIDNQWFNIYTDWNIQNMFLNSPFNIKSGNNSDNLNNGRNILYLIGKNKFKCWSDISWRFPSTGFHIESVDLIQK